MLTTAGDRVLAVRVVRSALLISEERVSLFTWTSIPESIEWNKFSGKRGKRVGGELSGPGLLLWFPDRRQIHRGGTVVSADNDSTRMRECRNAVSVSGRGRIGGRFMQRQICPDDRRFRHRLVSLPSQAFVHSETQQSQPGPTAHMSVQRTEKEHWSKSFMGAEDWNRRSNE